MLPKSDVFVVRPGLGPVYEARVFKFWWPQTAAPVAGACEAVVK